MRAGVFCASARQQAHRNRRIRRTECGQPRLGNSHALLFGQPPERRHIAELALIGRHSECGITFEMLNRAIALGPRQIDIRQRHIILKIDEAFLWCGNRDNIEHGFGIGCPAYRRHILTRCRWDKGLRSIVPIERAACLHMQMHDGCEATGNSDQISIPALGQATDTRGHAFQAMARAFGRKRNGVVIHWQAAVRARRCWPCIKNGHDLSPCCLERVGCFIRVIIIGRDHHAFARDDAKTIQIGPHGLRQHYAGAVIMRKGHRAFNAASRKYHLARPHMPKPLCNAVRRDLARLCYTLRQRDQIMLPISRRGGAGEDAPAGGADAGLGRFHPCTIAVLAVAD